MNSSKPMEGRCLRGAAAAVLTCVAALAATAAEYPAVPPEVGFDAVQALPHGQPDAVLRYGDAAPQFAELWLPESGKPAPVVVFIHGGCWLNAYGIDHSRALATALTDAGYAVWNIEYRRLGDEGGGWPGSLDDIRAALALLGSLDDIRVDRSRLALAGHSAGGHLALLAAAGPPGGLAPRAVFGLAPITDIARYAEGESGCNQAAAQFLAGLSEPEIEAANPVLQPAPPGTVLMLGSADSIVPFEAPFLEPEELVGMPAGHFDWIHPGTPAWSRFLEELESRL